VTTKLPVAAEEAAEEVAPVMDEAAGVETGNQK
jgi:hypothetical protein